MVSGETAELIAQKIIANKNNYYRLAFSFCANKDDSMDAIADMTMIVLQKYNSLRDPDMFFSWSNKILVNICKKKWAHSRRNIYLEDVKAKHEIPAESPDNVMSADIDRALVSVTPRFREVIILKEVLGYTFRDIAVMARIPLRTAQSRYNYGMKEMRKFLGGSYNE